MNKESVEGKGRFCEKRYGRRKDERGERGGVMLKNPSIHIPDHHPSEKGGAILAQLSR